MEGNKKILLFGIPMSICNFRCHYCYLAQRESCYEGIQPEMKYTPAQFREAFSRRRLGGVCYANFCADGETLLTRNIDSYIRALVDEGHYVEIVTNMSVTPVLNKILAWGREALSHVSFKCSFHYLELKKKGMLELFAGNVNRAWAAGASASVEVTPTDELAPFVDELKSFSMEHFGALPHLSIARDDRSRDIAYLTKMDLAEYDCIWSAFDSGFWRFKKTLFGRRQKGFCYAGAWSVHVNLATGVATCCYGHLKLGDVVARPDHPFPSRPVGCCPIAHCYNGHALLSMGLIPHEHVVGYGDIRDREREDGTHWLRPELRTFFNTRLEDQNVELSRMGQALVPLKNRIYKISNKVRRRLS